MIADFRSISVEGRVVRYVEAGDRASGRVLLLLHGFPLGVQMWHPQVAAFAGWRVIVPALPGFDGSDPWPEPSVETYARQALGLLDALGVERAVVGGLSMGGYVTFALLRQALGRAAGVILADTRTAADAPEALVARERMIALVSSDGPAAVAGDMIEKLFGPTTLSRRPEVVADVRRMIEAQLAGTIADALRALMTRPDASLLVASLRLPALVIVGEEDSLTPPVDSERIHAAIPGSTLVRIPGAGHMSNVETPGEFNAAVSRFLRNWPGDRSQESGVRS